jgi:hypothetical protein
VGGTHKRWKRGGNPIAVKFPAGYFKFFFLPMDSCESPLRVSYVGGQAHTSLLSSARVIGVRQAPCWI